MQYSVGNVLIERYESKDQPHSIDRTIFGDERIFALRYFYHNQHLPMGYRAFAVNPSPKSNLTWNDVNWSTVGKRVTSRIPTEIPQTFPEKAAEYRIRSQQEQDALKARIVANLQGTPHDVGDSCEDCDHRYYCWFAHDPYNTNGDCLAGK